MKSIFFRLAVLSTFLIMGFMSPVSSQTTGGKQIQFLWTGRKAPWPMPKPTWLADTSYTALDTNKNAWVVAYVPSNPNGIAMVVMPGGGYLNLAGWANEGVGVSLKMNTYGITTFILHYRVGISSGTGAYQHPCEMWDGQRAVRWVRAHAAEYGINPNRVGVMGFSAGGHLATSVATHYDSGNPDSTSLNFYPGPRDSIDKYSCKPDFQVLGYPMVTMISSFAYTAGRTALLGSSHSLSLDTLMSNEMHVTPSSPPVFIVYGTSDNTVNPKNSTVYRDSLTSKGLPPKIIAVNTTSHGFALANGQYGTNIPAAAVWPDSMWAWLQRGGFTTTIISKSQKGHSISPIAIGRNQSELDLLGRLSIRPHGFVLKALPIKE